MEDEIATVWQMDLEEIEKMILKSDIIGKDEKLIRITPVFDGMELETRKNKNLFYYE